MTRIKCEICNKLFWIAVGATIPTSIVIALANMYNISFFGFWSKLLLACTGE